MKGLTVYEFDALVAEAPGRPLAEGTYEVAAPVFAWLERICLVAAEQGESPWLRLTQRRGRRAVQLTSYVGVIQAPDGFQIEVLPKVGKAIDGGIGAARSMLIEMLACLDGFRHVATDNALLAAQRMPLLDVFIAQFLGAVQTLLKQGLRSDYVLREQNLHTLRGKLLVAANLRHNLCRADRFVCEYEEFSADRAENRLLHAALRRVLTLAGSLDNLRLGRELVFVFADVPVSSRVADDFKRVRLERGMRHYGPALDWARLILAGLAPVPQGGAEQAPSLLFPMAALFESFVARSMRRHLAPALVLKSQARSEHLVRHQERNWFRLKPDLLVVSGSSSLLVLDTKWKLLDGRRTGGANQYGLAQGDFYQLQAYGHSYLDGQGDLVLIYPKTDSFPEPLKVFTFPKAAGLRLWVLPFCMGARSIMLPKDAAFPSAFDGIAHAATPLAPEDELSGL
jgi:5-methylcytosine-specific restriction enzyme subunit McrC